MSDISLILGVPVYWIKTEFSWLYKEIKEKGRVPDSCREEISDLYLNERWKLEDIASKFSTTKYHISSALKKWGISVWRQRPKKNYFKSYNFTLDSLLETYYRLESLKLTVLELNVPRWVISEILERNNIAPFRGDKVKTMWENKEEITKRYFNGDKIEDIANAFDFNPSHLAATIQGWGLRRERRTKIIADQVLKENGEDIIQKYKNGLNITEIAEPYKIDHSYISTFLKNNGIFYDLSRQYKESRLERSFAEILTRKNIKFSRNLYLERRVFDFYISDLSLVIETNGDFWHGSIKKYPDPSKLLLSQQRGRERDLIKKDIAERSGMNIIFLWESEIYKQLLIVEEILDSLFYKIPKQSGPDDFLTDWAQFNSKLLK